MMKNLIGSFAVFGLIGCAGIEIPPQQLERSEAGIRAAEEVGAEDVPNAKLHLQLAKEQAEKAKKMAKDGDKRAMLVLARSESDAELALALAREKAAQTDSIKTTEDLKAIRARGEP